MTLDVLGPGSAVVILGLAAAVAWGAADFGGGLAARHAPLFGVVLASQLGGLAVAAGVAAIRGESVPAPADVGWSAAAGICAGTGVMSLYHGLASGRMAVVAPVTGVLAAALPVLLGVAIEGVPAPQVIAGIGLALAAVVVVSRPSGADAGGRGSGLRWAVLAGVGLGGFNVTISRVSEGFVFGPLVLVRAVEALLLVAVVVVGRQAWRFDRRLLPAVILVGVVDMAANGSFVLAAQAGPLAVASVLSSLYPVTTVMLATLVLREPMNRTHLVGVGTALAAIVLIASG